MKYFKRGFTLIELLVVIAIIAILAAILFPVFAQAKAAAKKTQAISNIKNMATADSLYGADNEDTYGNAVPFIPGVGTNTWAWDRFIPMSELLLPTTPPAVADGVNSMYNNAINPYVKNRQILVDPTAGSRSPLPAGAFTAAGITVIPPTAPAITYTFNGLLQSMSSTAVVAPANTITWWPGQGRRGLQGAHYNSPQMYCFATGGVAGTCQYRPATDSTCSGGANGGSSFYTTNSSNFGFDMHNRTLVYAYADGHASSKRVGVFTTGRTDPRIDPFAFYIGAQPANRTNPSIASRNFDRFYCHGYMFRPDIDYQNWDQVLIAP